MDPLSTSDLDGVLDLLRDAAREAAAIARGYFRPGARTTAAISTKEGGSPVTEADLAADRYLKERLTAALPGAGWLSEETADSDERLGLGSVLIVDPIDGTRAFVSGDARWCVSVALVTDGRPVVGVVDAPVLDQRFEAITGRGATLNGSPVRASARSSLDGAQIAGPGNFGQQFAGGAPFRVVPKIPSLACRFVHVAAGFLDGCVGASDSHDWDIAAADLIAREAGALVTDRFGSLLRYNRRDTAHPVIVGGPPPIHRALLDLLRHPGD